jgi:hypothetical protein
MAKKIVEPQIKYTAVCVNCGVFIPENKGLVRENRHYCENCAILTPVAAKPSILPPSGLLKILSYLVSLTPIAGFLFGVIFYSQSEPAAKNFGKKCFIMMFIGIAVMLLFFVLVLITGAAIGGAAGGLNLGEGYY